MVREPSLLLVGGTGRSGTTITKQVLGRHPAVASFPNEMRLLADPDGVGSLVRVAVGHPTPHELDTAVRRFLTLLDDIARPHPVLGRARRAGSGENSTRQRKRTRSPRALVRSAGGRVIGSRAMPRYALTDLTPTAPHFRDLAARASDALLATSWPGRWAGMGRRDPSRMFLPTPDLVVDTLRQLVEGLLDDAAARSAPTTYVTDDTPTVLRSAAELARLLPGRVRAVEVVRDPRDVVASLIGSRWAPGTVEQCVDFYRVARASSLAGLAGLPPGDVLRVRLEDVVAAPTSELGRLAGWLEIDAGGFPTAADLGLRTGSTGRWRADLEPAAADLLERLLDDEVAQLGYDAEVSPDRPR